LQITYENEYIKELFIDLSDIANSKNLMQRKIGKDKTLAAKKRKNQLEAAPNFKSYLNLHLGNPHSLTGDLQNYYAVDINAHIRLVIKPDSKDLSSEELKKCKTVIIIGIIEYHGGKDEWLIS